jgi:predicted transcriptional regulator
MRKTKDKLLEKIQNINDESILNEIMEMVELDLVGEVIQLSDEQKKIVDEGLKDKESGNLISHNDARKITDEWLKRGEMDS